MDGFDANVNEAPQVATSPYFGGQKMASVPTLQQRIDLAVAQAEERLKAVKEARDILSRNPDLEKLLNIMQRSHF